jgi:Fe-S-cluster-containing hydrogenase component 2
MELIINPNLNTNSRRSTEKPDVVCPSCNHSYCERIPRTKIVKALSFWLDVRRYKCYGCWRKFYVLGNRKRQLHDLLSR